MSLRFSDSEAKRAELLCRSGPTVPASSGPTCPQRRREWSASTFPRSCCCPSAAAGRCTVIPGLPAPPPPSGAPARLAGPLSAPRWGSARRSLRHFNFTFLTLLHDFLFLCPRLFPPLVRLLLHLLPACSDT